MVDHLACPDRVRSQVLVLDLAVDDRLRVDLVGPDQRERRPASDGDEQRKQRDHVVDGARAKPGQHPDPSFQRLSDPTQRARAGQGARRRSGVPGGGEHIRA